MFTLIIVVHVIVCIALVIIVLLQAGKGAEMGAAFGGASQTVFGSAGSGGFLSKLTTGAAIIFMITSLSLSYIAASRGSRSVVTEGGKPAAGQTVPGPGPSNPGQPPAPGTVPQPSQLPAPAAPK